MDLDEDGLLCSSPPRKRRPTEQTFSVASPQLPTSTPVPPVLPRSDLPVLPGRPNLFPEPTPIVPAVVPEWVASSALIQNPAAIDNPLAVAGAAAETKRFNATWHATSLDPDSVVVECRAAMSNMFSACSAMVGNELAPIRPETPANLALRPDFLGLAAGTFDRIRGLIQSNYSVSYRRRSMKTAIRSFARHCARLGVSVFRPNVANNPTLIAQEEMILMTFRAVQHVVGLHHLDLADMLHQCVIETMAACLCRVGEAMPTKERMLTFFAQWFDLSVR